MSSTLTTESILKVSPSHVSSDLAGEQVILNLDNGVYYGLDEVGTRIWDLLNDPQSIDSVVDALHEEYDVERAELRADVMSLAGEMLEAGLVVHHDADGRS